MMKKSIERFFSEQEIQNVTLNNQEATQAISIQKGVSSKTYHEGDTVVVNIEKSASQVDQLGGRSIHLYGAPVFWQKIEQHLPRPLPDTLKSLTANADKMTDSDEMVWSTLDDHAVFSAVLSRLEDYQAKVPVSGTWQLNRVTIWLETEADGKNITVNGGYEESPEGELTSEIAYIKFLPITYNVKPYKVLVRMEKYLISVKQNQPLYGVAPDLEFMYTHFQGVDLETRRPYGFNGLDIQLNDKTLFNHCLRYDLQGAPEKFENPLLLRARAKRTLVEEP